MALFHFQRSPGSRDSPLKPGLHWVLFGVPLLVLLTLPLVALLLRVEAADVVPYLGREEVRQAIGLSLKTSGISVVLTVLLGTPLAFVLARGAFPFRSFIDACVDVPMVLPPAVAGIALLIAFGRQGLLGDAIAAFGVQIPFSQAAVVLAQIFVAGPLYVRAAVIGLGRIRRDIEEAALIDGAGVWQVLRFITFPLSRNALLGGMVLMWARALGEFGATIIFAGNLPGRTQTMPLAIYLGFEIDLGVALTLSVLLMGLSLLILVAVRVLLRYE